MPKGKVIEKYRLLKQIGEGGFAYTYLAEHVITGWKACLKQNIDLDDEDRRLLIREAKLLASLSHYSIPACRDVIVLDDGAIIMVMGFVKGKELYKVVKRKYPRGLDPEHACWIAQRCLNTLHYSHSQGVIHGDFKPQNLLLEEDHHYKGYASHNVFLIDFGLATVKPRRFTRCPGYTEAFAAPEQLAGKPPIPATDLYCLGTTLIYILGGDIGAKTLPRRVPEELEDFVMRLVIHDPLKRPQEAWPLIRELSDMRKRVFGKRESGKGLKIA